MRRFGRECSSQDKGGDSVAGDEESSGLSSYSPEQRLHPKLGYGGIRSPEMVEATVDHWSFWPVPVRTVVQ